MHEVTFLQDLAVVMLVAGVTTIIFHRLKQPVVLGYILAGVIIGPYTPPLPLIHDQQTIKTLSELGVIFLMFSLGMEFSLRKLRQVGVAALIAALLEILLMVLVGYEIGRFFGWRSMDSLFLGAILSISSTTIIVKALAELGKTREKFAELIFGILIVEDILAIVMIALLSGIAVSGSLQAGVVVKTLGVLAIFFAVTLVVGLLAVPRILGYVARFKSNEMLLITVLALCFGVSLLAVKLGYSVALGAFIIGAIIAEARELGKIEILTEPIRDMFSAVFFVAIGLLIQPALLLQYAVPILVITIVVVVGKILACSFGTFVSGNDTRTSLRVGMGLAQIGEFSFIIASLGLSLKVTSDFLYPIAVAVSVLTTFLTPYLIKSSDGLVSWFDARAPKPLVDYLELYTSWIGGRAARRKDSLAGKLIRKWTFQLVLNTALVSGIFLMAAFVARGRFAWFPRLPVAKGAWDAILWLGATVLSLPLFIATARKLEAMGMLIADLSVSQSKAGEGTRKVRALVARSVSLAGLLAMALLVFVLSAPFWPPVEIFIGLIAVAVLIGALFWRYSIKVYSQAQIALKETFAQPSPSRRPEAQPEIHQLLNQSGLLTVPIEPASPASGKLIRELRLRTVTGASIVGIQRGGDSIINPGPDEELLPGDQVLLLGTPGQLAAGNKALRGN